VGAGQHGVIFRAWPTFIGGGVQSKVVSPGERKLLIPGETLYLLDTGVQSVSWGEKDKGDNKSIEDWVETRASDGNEVRLSVTVQYELDPTKLPHIIQNVGIDNQSVRKLVVAVAQADIRTHVNSLKTREFIRQDARRQAFLRVHEAIKRRLGPEGIVVKDVFYDKHQFERVLADGRIDSSYQDLLDQTKAVAQQTEQERKKIATVTEGKKKEFQVAQAIVNRKIETAKGEKAVMTQQGDAELAVRQNRAEMVRETGIREIAGLKEKISAYKGEGGRALLRQAIYEALLKNNPNFVLMNSSSDNSPSLDVNTIDSNELIRQVGVFSAMQKAQGQKNNAEVKQSQPVDPVNPSGAPSGH